MKNWDKYKEDFVRLFISDDCSLNSFTNNRAEGLNSAIKKWVEENKNTSKELIAQLFMYVADNRLDYTNTISKWYLKEFTGIKKSTLKIQRRNTYILSKI